MPAPVIPVPGRTCGDCAMCCKLGAIKEVNKPDGQWCKHCSSHSKCDVYALRPDVCKVYHCHFLLSDLDESWRPSRCHLMVSALPNNLVYISVDADHPHAWQTEPYFSYIRGWANNHRVVVLVGSQIYAVYPDRIDDLGMLHTGHALTFTLEETAMGTIQRTIMVNGDLNILPVVGVPRR